MPVQSRVRRVAAPTSVSDHSSAPREAARGLIWCDGCSCASWGRKLPLHVPRRATSRTAVPLSAGALAGEEDTVQGATAAVCEGSEVQNFRAGGRTRRGAVWEWRRQLHGGAVEGRAQVPCTENAVAAGRSQEASGRACFVSRPHLAAGAGVEGGWSCSSSWLSRGPSKHPLHATGVETERRADSGPLAAGAGAMRGADHGEQPGASAERARAGAGGGAGSTPGQVGPIWSITRKAGAPCREVQARDGGEPATACVGQWARDEWRERRRRPNARLAAGGANCAGDAPPGGGGPARAVLGGDHGARRDGVAS